MMPSPSDVEIIPVPISLWALQTLLRVAATGGSAYWATFSHQLRTAGGDYLAVMVREREPHAGTPAIHRQVGCRDLIRGLGDPSLQARQALSNVIIGYLDPTTADTALQLTLFGELRYGQAPDSR